MDTAQQEHIVTAVLLLAAALALLRFLHTEYRLGKIRRAAVETARATAYHKHPEMKAVLTGRSSTYVYHITFHTDSGDILKLYMNPTEYYSIHEGDTGRLTWQRKRFWKFEKEE